MSILASLLDSLPCLPIETIASIQGQPKGVPFVVSVVTGCIHVIIVIVHVIW